MRIKVEVEVEVRIKAEERHGGATAVVAPLVSERDFPSPAPRRACVRGLGDLECWEGCCKQAAAAHGLYLAGLHLSELRLSGLSERAKVFKDRRGACCAGERMSEAEVNFVGVRPERFGQAEQAHQSKMNDLRFHAGTLHSRHDVAKHVRFPEKTGHTHRAHTESAHRELPKRCSWRRRRHPNCRGLRHVEEVVLADDSRRGEVFEVWHDGVQVAFVDAVPKRNRVPQLLPALRRQKPSTVSHFEIRIFEAGELAEDLTALHRAAGDEHVAAPGVVHSGAAVRDKRAGELGGHHDHRVVPDALQLQLLAEAREARAHLGEPRLRIGLGVRVPVVVAVLDVERVPVRAEVVAPRDQLRDQLEARGQPLPRLEGLVEGLLEPDGRVREGVREPLGRLERLDERSGPRVGEEGRGDVVAKLHELLRDVGRQVVPVVDEAARRRRLALRQVSVVKALARGQRVVRGLVRFACQVVAADGVGRNVIALAVHGVVHAAEDARAGVSLGHRLDALGVHRLHVVRVEVSGHLSRVVHRLLGQRLDERPDVGDEGQVAVVVHLLDRGQEVGDAEHVAVLGAGRDVDGQQLVPRERHRSGADAQILVVGRHAVALVVGNKDVPRVEASVEVQVDDRLVVLAILPERAVAGVAQAVRREVGRTDRVELGQDRHELQGSLEGLVQRLLDDELVVQRDEGVDAGAVEATASQEQVKIVDQVEGRAGWLLVLDAAPGVVLGVGEVSARHVGAGRRGVRGNAEAVGAVREAELGQRQHAVQERNDRWQVHDLGLRRVQPSVANDAGRLILGNVEVEDCRGPVRHLRDEFAQVGELDFPVVPRRELQGPHEVDDLQKRLAHLSVGRIRLDRRRHRLAIQQQRRYRRSEVSPGAGADAIEGARVEGVRDGLDVPWGRVRRGEAPDQEVRDERRGVLVVEELVQHSLRLGGGLAHRVLLEAHERGRVAEAELAADRHHGNDVREEAIRPPGRRHREDGLLVEHEGVTVGVDRDPALRRASGRRALDVRAIGERGGVRRADSQLLDDLPHGGHVRGIREDGGLAHHGVAEARVALRRAGHASAPAIGGRVVVRGPFHAEVVEVVHLAWVLLVGGIHAGHVVHDRHPAIREDLRLRRAGLASPVAGEVAARGGVHGRERAEAHALVHAAGLGRGVGGALSVVKIARRRAHRLAGRGAAGAARKGEAAVGAGGFLPAGVRHGVARVEPEHHAGSVDVLVQHLARGRDVQLHIMHRVHLALDPDAAEGLRERHEALQLARSRRGDGVAERLVERRVGVKDHALDGRIQRVGQGVGESPGAHELVLGALRKESLLRRLPAEREAISHVAVVDAVLRVVVAPRSVELHRVDAVRRAFSLGVLNVRSRALPVKARPHLGVGDDVVVVIRLDVVSVGLLARAVFVELVEADGEQLHDLARVVLVREHRVPKLPRELQGERLVEAEHVRHGDAVGHFLQGISEVAEGVAHEDVIVRDQRLVGVPDARVEDVHDEYLGEGPRHALPKLVRRRHGDRVPHRALVELLLEQLRRLIDRLLALLCLQPDQVPGPEVRVVLHLARRAASLVRLERRVLVEGAHDLRNVHGLHGTRQAQEVQLLAEPADERVLLAIQVPAVHGVPPRVDQVGRLPLDRPCLDGVGSVVGRRDAVAGMRVLSGPVREVEHRVHVRMDVLPARGLPAHRDVDLHAEEARRALGVLRLHIDHRGAVVLRHDQVRQELVGLHVQHRAARRGRVHAASLVTEPAGHVHARRPVDLRERQPRDVVDEEPG
eukprot:scaffold180_cov311-Pinguiococcus_pyrenoidosus.AAC.34